jgi:hypothetical protein
MIFRFSLTAQLVRRSRPRFPDLHLQHEATVRRQYDREVTWDEIDHFIDQHLRDGERRGVRLQ